MKHHELTAWHYATRRPVTLRWKDGRISALEPAAVEPPKSHWLAPSLLDLQVNGFAGVDFQQDHVTQSDLLKAVRGLRAAGCTRFFLTLITDDWPKMLARLRHLRHLRAHSPELHDAIAGWHVEGPFLSSAPGYCGAHDPRKTCDAYPRHMRELRQAAGQDSVLLTLAPLRANAIAVIALAVSLGITVSLGHTNAPRRRLEQAVKAGATGFTHLGNGCPRELDRFDNILWRVFETAGMTVSLIPDRVHVSPPLFRIMHRILPADHIYYITDAMAAAGAPPGRYPLSSLQLEVGEDEVVRLPGSANLAGSALTPIQGVLRATRMLKCAWTEAWQRFSDAPAKFMRLPLGLVVGQPADFCVVQASTEREIDAVKVFVAGEEVAAW